MSGPQRRLLLSVSSSDPDAGTTVAAVELTPELVRLVLDRHRHVAQLASQAPGLESAAWWDLTCTFSAASIDCLAEQDPAAASALDDDNWLLTVGGAGGDLALQRTEHELMHVNDHFVWWSSSPGGSDVTLETWPIALSIFAEAAERDAVAAQAPA